MILWLIYIYKVEKCTVFLINWKNNHWKWTTQSKIEKWQICYTKTVYTHTQLYFTIKPHTHFNNMETENFHRTSAAVYFSTYTLPLLTKGHSLLIIVREWLEWWNIFISFLHYVLLVIVNVTLLSCIERRSSYIYSIPKYLLLKCRFHLRAP